MNTHRWFRPETSIAKLRPAASFCEALDLLPVHSRPLICCLFIRNSDWSAPAAMPLQYHSYIVLNYPPPQYTFLRPGSIAK